MNYWIISLPREHMEHCVRVGVFGLNRKYILGQVNKGDRVACYVTKEYKVIALGEVTEGYYVDDKKVFLGEGMFPDRFDFRSERLAKPMDFMKVIEQMSFIKNLAYWSAYFRNGIVKISEKDYLVIEKASKSA